MANACFRCEHPIDSGGTFCTDCEGEVSLEFTYTEDTSLWLVVAGVPVLFVLLVAGSAAYNAAFGSANAVAAAASILYFPLGIAFVYALYRDCQHVRRRDDADWEPSPIAYALLGWLCVMLVLPMFLLAPVYLYVRRKRIGLQRRGAADE